MSEILSLARLPEFSAFVLQKESIENNHGMLGRCSLSAVDDGTEFTLSATLEPQEPDNSDDELRSRSLLTLTLAINDQEVASYGPVSHCYLGESPGNYLSELLESEDLYQGFKHDLQTGRLSLAQFSAIC